MTSHDRHLSARPERLPRQLAELVVYDDDESDIIAWPGDFQGRNINWRMTPARAVAWAELLDTLEYEWGLPGWSEGIAAALREAAGRVNRTVTGSRPTRVANPLPRRCVDATLPPSANRNTPPESDT